MYTWIYYEFVNSVHFPNDRASIRADSGIQYTAAAHDAIGVTFKCASDVTVFVPWANVRYAGGCVTPKFEPVTDDVTVTAPALKDLAAEATSIRLVKKPKK
jgi:hypothetical protein